MDWDVIEGHWPRVVCLARRLARRPDGSRDTDLETALLDEFVDRLPRIHEIWSQAGEPCAFWTKARRSLRWYAHKLMNRRTRYANSHSPLVAEDGATIDPPRVQLLVEELGTRIGKRQAQLLEMRFVAEMTWCEMAEELGCSPNKARGDTLRALDDAKKILQDEGCP